MTLAQEVINIKRAYHCPQKQAEILGRADQNKYKAILWLGPMRVHWRKNWGWMLYNKIARLWEIEEEYYRLSAKRLSAQGKDAGRVRVLSDADL